MSRSASYKQRERYFVRYKKKENYDFKRILYTTFFIRIRICYTAEHSVHGKQLVSEVLKLTNENRVASSPGESCHRRQVLRNTIQSISKPISSFKDVPVPTGILLSLMRIRTGIQDADQGEKTCRKLAKGALITYMN